MFKSKIVKAVKKGSLDQDDLRRCCGNVVRSVLDSAIQREYLEK